MDDHYKKLVGGVLLVAIFALATRQVYCQDEQRSTEVLVPTTSEGIRQLLQQLVPSGPQRKEMRSYLRLLGDDSYVIRESASRKLLKYATIPNAILEETLESSDLETLMRASHIARSQQQQRLLNTLRESLHSIRDNKLTGVTVPLIEALATHYELNSMWDSARYAIDATSEPSDEAALLEATKHKNPLVRASVVGAYGRIAGPDGIDHVLSLLKDDHERVRLAAATAVGNANRHECLDVFVELLGSNEVEIRLAAIQSLRALTSQQFEYSALETGAARQRSEEAWRGWVRKHGPTAQLTSPLPDSWTLHLLDSLDHWIVIADGKPTSSNKLGIRLRQGVLICPTNVNCFMRTTAAFRNYELRYQWRWPTNQFNDAGIMVMLDDKNIGMGNGLEVQLHHQHAGDFYKIGDFIKGKMMSGEDSRIASGHERPLGEWNEMRIKVLRGRINVHINGRLHNEANQVPQVQRHIGIRLEGSPIEFRRMELTPLD